MRRRSFFKKVWGIEQNVFMKRAKKLNQTISADSLNKLKRNDENIHNSDNDNDGII